MRLPRLLIGLSLSAMAASQAHAQVATDIAPDTDPGFDTGTVVTTTGNSLTVTGGEAEAGNLFHSFSEFDLASGDIVTWARNAADAGLILNIINRVRSGTPSDINGTLNVSDMPNANFYFINPAGVIFGAGAAVNVPNAAYFSTAQELRFSSGPTFSTITPDGSTFSSAAPSAFGFLGGQGIIEALQGFQTGSNGIRPSSISFVASDISLGGVTNIRDADANFVAIGNGAETVSLADLLTVKGNGTIDLRPGFDFSEDFGGHTVSLSGSVITLDAAKIILENGGDIALYGTTITLDNGSEVTSRNPLFADGDIVVETVDLNVLAGSRITTGSSVAKGVALGDINITATGSLRMEGSGTEIASSTSTTEDTGNVSVIAGSFDLTGSRISTTTFSGGNAGAVTITADSGTMTDLAAIRSFGTSGSSGSLGAVSVDVAGDLNLTNNASIASLVFGDGNGRSVDVSASRLFMNRASIQSYTEDAAGHAGNMTVTVDELYMHISSIQSSAIRGSGNAGNITVSANTARMTGDNGSTASRIDSSTYLGATGQGGSLEIEIANDFSGNFALIAAVTDGSGHAGSIDISAGSMDFTDTSIRSSTFSSGNAGSILINTGQLNFTGERIDSFTRGSGKAGTITINATNAVLTDTNIGSQALFGSTGEAGAVTINLTEDLIVAGNTAIQASTAGTGNAGQVDIQARDLTMSGGQISSAATSASSATAGGVAVRLTGDLTMTGGIISSNTSGAGAAGAVLVTAQNAFLSGFPQITAGSGGSGAAGSVEVRIVDRLSMIGPTFMGTIEGPTIAATTGSSGEGGNVIVTARSLDLANGKISSNTNGSGNAGTVTVSIEDIDISAGFISSFTTSSLAGAGNAGSVTINANTLDMTGGSVTSQSTLFAAGNAGFVDVNITDSLTMSGQTEITSKSIGTGHAGTVNVDVANTLSLSEIARISATTTGPGDAGSVAVDAGLLLMDGGQISSSTEGDGNAGDVIVRAANANLSGGSINSQSKINAQTSALASGNAGSVVLDVANQLDMSLFAEVSASTVGTGNAGDVIVTATDASLSDFVSINSQTTNGSSGNAGNVLVTASGFLRLADTATISASTEGVGRAGSVLANADQLLMDGGRIVSSTSDGGDAGNVIVKARVAALSSAATINSASLLGATGSAGDVRVTIAEQLSVADTAAISASTNGVGDAGLVQVIAAQLDMIGGAIASSTSGTGSAGNVIVAADKASLKGDATVNSASLPGATGNAGDVRVTITGQLLVSDSAEISAATNGTGDAGLVDVTAQVLEMTGGAINSFTDDTGNAGLVSIAVDRLEMSGGRIDSASDSDVVGAGNAGGVVITARNASLSGTASIDSRSITGDAGDVLFSIAETLSVADEAEISAATSGSGVAGNVLINADTLLVNGGEINSFTEGSGDAGLVSIVVNTLTMTGGRIDSASESDADNAGNAGNVEISAQAAKLAGAAKIDSQGITGAAGDVLLTIAGTLSLSDTAEISAATSGSGDAGAVSIVAGALTMTGGEINSVTTGTGDAGLVTVDVGELMMAGGRISSASEDGLQQTGIASLGAVTVAAIQVGDAGDVLVIANNGKLTGDASIDSVGETGNAGNVTVLVAGTLDISGNASIAASTRGAGNAGFVDLDAARLTMSGGEVSSSTTGSGNAGDVIVSAASGALTGSASINSQTFSGSSGNAGRVTVFIDEQLTLDQQAEISTSAKGTGNAGDIDISAQRLLLDNRSSIASTAAGTSSAGSIRIFGDFIRIDNGSRVTTNSENGPAGDITLTLPNDGFLGLSGIDPGVITTSSGANTGGRITISNPFLILSEGGSILALGEQGGANVTIQSSFFIRSADTINLLSVDGSLVLDSQIGDQITGTEPVDLGFLDASGILSGQCSASGGSGQTSRFSSQITGPYAPISVPEPNDSEKPAQTDGDPKTIAGLDTLAPCL